MDFVRFLQYFCSIAGALCLGFTYYHMFKRDAPVKKKNHSKVELSEVRLP